MTRDATERAAYLSGVCGDDATLRDEVADLLAVAASLPEDFLRPLRQVSLDAPDAPDGVPERSLAQRQAGGLAEAPATGQTAEPPPGNGSAADWLTLDSTSPDDLHDSNDAPVVLVGSHVGPFEVLRIIAGGGMGVVYEARQQQPRRPVALKIMKPGYTTPTMRRRFQLEAELLGRLRHPNIAQVYHAGLADTPLGKLPYFALEYVAGARSITQYADQENLDLRQRLALFATVCDAVQHGHRNGVIHRDLKPANILVDEHGQPKLIDFGVARLTERDAGLTTAHTLVGQIIGTVQYMSPEQCDGDPAAVDTRSDVYSLGVILYELLTGTLPYRASSTSLVSATRTIRDHEPARPSTINRKLRGDIETVLLKTLKKDREKRYASADALARDIRHVLNREPVEARRPTLIDHVARWAVRHPVVLTVAMCILIVAVTAAAAGITYWYALLRPDYVELTNGRRAAVLRSGAGVELCRWSVDPPGTTSLAHLLRATVGGKERLLAIVGFKYLGGLKYAQGVFVFDCDGDRDTPLWSGRLEPSDVPAVLSLRDERLFAPAEFYAGRLAVADVFDPPAGPELIVAYQHNVYTQTALRIYALDGGEVLWQVWMDFDVIDACWLSQPGVLLIAGAEARVHWEQRGIVGPPPTRHPHAVMALRPQRGYREVHYVASDHPDERLRPRWIKCLMPATDAFRLDYLCRDETFVPWSVGTETQMAGVVLKDSHNGSAGVTWAFGGDGPVAAIRPRYDGNYVDRTMLPRDDPRWVPSAERIDPETGKPEIYWGELPDIQWFHADERYRDPVTRDLQLYFDVDLTADKQRRGAPPAPKP